MKTIYESCLSKIMNKTIKKYKKGELKDRSNKKITSRKQAVAIGLSISNKECEKKFSKNDYKKIEEKFYKNIYDDFENHKISEKKLNYSTVKNGIKLVEYYRSKRKYIKANSIINSMIVKILFEIKKGNKINKLIIDDLLVYLK